MVSRRAGRAVLMLSLAACCVQCSQSSDAPRGQVVLFIDTDAPIASQTFTSGVKGATDVKRDASVDTLRIDILGNDDRPIAGKTNIIPASDQMNWPVSFGLQTQDDAKLARLRLRAFRARNAEARTDPDTQAQIYEPVAGYTIDRIVEVPLPDKGAYALRVVLRSRCRGKRSDLVYRTSCVDNPDEPGGFRDGIEVLPTEAARDLSALPARPEPWWPARGTDCPEAASTAERACIPGGFFMLGNLRVVGFGSLRRADAVPAHPVVMHPFLIDRNEMTVGRYAQEVGAPPSTSDKGCTANLGDPSLPLNCVTWDEAQAACLKLGGRLPTEAEWEYVASGRGRGYLFPWGDQPPNCKAASLGHRPSSAGFEQCEPLLVNPMPVGSHTRDNLGPEELEAPRDDLRDPEVPGRILDLAGSVSEWMLDTFKPYDEDKQCWERDGLLTHPACLKGSGTASSIRGGNWANQMEVAYVALRNNQTTGGFPSVGFRCVYPLEPASDPLLRGSNKADYEQFVTRMQGGH